MSNYYTPERWVIIEINSKEHGTIKKILGSWYGGYAGSDSWRMSSGITKVVEKFDEDIPYYEVHNESGSVYTCYRDIVGMSMYTTTIFNYYKDKVEAADGSIKIIDIKEAA